MKYFLFSLSVTMAMLVGGPAEAEHVERIALYQKPEVMAHQRGIVGNLRAVARREGIVVNVPQLFVYHADFTEAYHMDGFRPGFERELALTLDRRRGARSMVRLDRLLERAKTAEGKSLQLSDLPEADFYLALYRRANCEECDRLMNHVEQWLTEQSEREVVWLDVRTDRPRGQ